MLLTRKLKRYARRFDNVLKSEYFGLYDDKIREILEYTLKGGKRMRPAIIYDILHSLGKNGVEIDGKYLALMTEFIHTSSLIIDDLPCMDNDDMRRGRESVHKRYGLLASKLVSTLLMSDAHTMLFKMYDNIDCDDIDDRLLKVLDVVTSNIGIKGAAYGQYLDMLPKYSNEFVEDVINTEIKEYTSENIIGKIIEKKTGVIFEIAFVSAYILGGGDLDDLERVKKVSYDFGMIFQIYDDYKDEEEDRKRMINGLTPNYVIRFGRERALLKMRSCILSFRENMIELGLYSKFFNDMMLFLYKNFKD